MIINIVEGIIHTFVIYVITLCEGIFIILCNLHKKSQHALF